MRLNVERTKLVVKAGRFEEASDLLRGAGNSHVVTRVERSSCFVTLIKVSGKDTGTAVAALRQHVQRLRRSVAALTGIAGWRWLSQN